MNKYNRTLVLATSAITALGALPTMTYGTWQVDMFGTPMTAVPVTGNITF